MRGLEMAVSSVAAKGMLMHSPAFTRRSALQSWLPGCWSPGHPRPKPFPQLQTQCRGQRLSVVCAASKTARKKSAKKKRSKTGGSGQDFDQLMLVWDDVFQTCCDDSSRARIVRSVARQGLERHGRGCVLVTESVRTLARGAGSGFSNKRRPDSDEVPAYASIEWVVEYVPRNLIEDPSAASENSATGQVTAEGGDEEFRLVKPSNWLAAVRSMVDRTRLLALTAGQKDGHLLEDAGGEAPYDAHQDELVLVLSVAIDGNVTVGADVVVANLDKPAGETEASWDWKLIVRDLLSFSSAS